MKISDILEETPKHGATFFDLTVYRAISGLQWVELTSKQQPIPIPSRGMAWFAFDRMALSGGKSSDATVISDWHLQLYAFGEFNKNPGVIFKTSIRCWRKDGWIYFPAGWGAGSEYGIGFPDEASDEDVDKIQNDPRFKPVKMPNGEYFHSRIPASHNRVGGGGVIVNGIVSTKPITNYEVVQSKR